MVHGYAEHSGLAAPVEEIERDALEWTTTRGSRSGRTAWQFTQDLAGRLGKPLAGLTNPNKEGPCDARPLIGAAARDEVIGLRDRLAASILN